MRFFSVFSGVGGFELGIEKAYGNRPNLRNGTKVLSEVLPSLKERTDGATCIGFSEIDKYASAVLRYRFPHVKNYGSITDINWADVPDFDLLVGGSPCQDFSIAGKRAGLVGARSGLAYEYIRALEEKRPAGFIWENVKGVLSSNRGWDFAAILNQMAEAGYSLWWQVLNAKDFGVPQNRERVFVVGTRNGSPREVFFERGNDKTDSEKSVGQTQNETNTIQAGYGKAHGGDTYITENTLIRRVTPRECEHLMGWPGDWTRYGDTGEISDTQRYKMCGNGVVSNVVAEVFNAHFL